MNMSATENGKNATSVNTVTFENMHDVFVRHWSVNGVRSMYVTTDVYNRKNKALTYHMKTATP